LSMWKTPSCLFKRCHHNSKFC